MQRVSVAATAAVQLGHSCTDVDFSKTTGGMSADARCVVGLIVVCGGRETIGAAFERVIASAFCACTRRKLSFGRVVTLGLIGRCWPLTGVGAATDDFAGALGVAGIAKTGAGLRGGGVTTLATTVAGRAVTTAFGLAATGNVTGFFVLTGVGALCGT